jgi:acetylglutamate kinase
MKDNMYYGASHLIFQRAEELRNRMTPAEESLWHHLHINEWKLKFRRQHPISNYVVDFYCHSIKLVIELDGGIHEVEEVKRLDAERQENLKALGLTVIRFKNEVVFNDRKIMLETISNHIKLLQSPPLGGRGKRLYVIKIGGNVIDDEVKLTSFLQSFALLNEKKILVHGGGKLATRIAEAMGINQQMIDGRRITDAETLKIVTMVYAGYINKTIVAKLQSLGCSAFGMCGADGNTIKAHKRLEGVVDYGFAGDIDKVNLEMLHTLLQSNDAIVLAPITHDGKGQLLNTNADTIAQETAKEMSKLYDVDLIYSFEKKGVLLDVNDETTLIKKLTQAYYNELKNPPSGGRGAIFAGMLPKLDNAFAAVNAGVQKVVIGKAEELQQLIEGTSGTTIIHE